MSSVASREVTVIFKSLEQTAMCFIILLCNAVWMYEYCWVYNFEYLSLYIVMMVW